MKDPVVREEEVGEATAGDGECVRQEDGQVCGADEEAHEREVSEKRDEAVGEMEAEELFECFARSACGCGPGEANVPGEVVEEREFDGEGGGDEVVARERAVEECERRELDCDAEETDEIEAKEVDQGVGSREMQRGLRSAASYELRAAS